MGEAMRLPLSCASLLLLVAIPRIVFAHRLDEYLQATLVHIEPDGIRLQINLTPGVEVAEKVLAQIDKNGDGVISTNEATAYAELLKQGLSVWLDGQHADLRLMTSEFPEAGELRTGWGIIRLEYSVSTDALASGVHKLRIANKHLPHLSVYLLNAAHPSSGNVLITAQKRNKSQSNGEIEFTVRSPSNASTRSGA